mgnify:CR=1 FL=1
MLILMMVILLVLLDLHPLWFIVIVHVYASVNVIVMF